MLNMKYDNKLKRSKNPNEKRLRLNWDAMSVGMNGNDFSGTEEKRRLNIF